LSLLVILLRKLLLYFRFLRVNLFPLGFKADFLLLYNLNRLILFLISHELHLRLIIIKKILIILNLLLTVILVKAGFVELGELI
jgi:hypothetical protein